MKRLCLATALLLVCVNSASAESVRALTARAAEHIAEWNYNDARPLIEALNAQAPTVPETIFLRAEMAFLDGKYTSAMQILDTLPGNKHKRRAERLSSLISSTLVATDGFTSYRSRNGHFEILYKPGKDEVIVELAGDALELAYEAIGDDLGYRPQTPVRVELLQQPKDLAKTSTLTENEIRTTGTIALCKYNKLMAVTPRATVFGYAWIDTLVHEYVHYVVSVKSRDKVPVWLHEGLARFEQDRWRRGPGGTLSGTDEHLLSQALRKNQFISWEEMHPSMAKLPSREAAALAYAEVLTLVQYVHDQKSMSGLRDVITAVANGDDARVAVAKVMKDKWDGVERGWRGFLRAARLKANNELAGRAKSGHLRFESGGEKSENVGLDEIKDKNARAFTRLGGMLRARGLSAAAAIEYEKALAITGAGDPMVSAKLSRTYLELKEFRRAIELAKPLLDADDNDAAPATTLGSAHLAVGEPGAAAEAFERAIRVNPFDPSVRCGLADAYRQLAKITLSKREQAACDKLRR